MVDPRNQDMPRPSRRDILKSVAAGATTLTFAGTVSGADGSEQYVVTAKGGGVGDRLEKDGFAVLRELAGGDVFVVEGSEDPASVKGVDESVANFKLRRERVAVDASDGEADDVDVPTDDESLYGFQWDKQTTDTPEAHETSTGEDASIAIIDSGTDVDHPDIAPNVVPGGLFRFGGEGVGVAGEPGVYLASESPEGVPVRIPSDPLTTLSEVQDYGGDDPVGVGYLPEDFETVTDRRVDDDVDGHGSHVAGIAAATVGSDVLFEDFTGIAGIAPDATIVPHRVFYWIEEEVAYENEDGAEVTETLINQYASFADILAAIDFAANAVGVDAMNLSIGTSPLPPQVNSDGIRQATNLVVRDAVKAGSVVVVSAGNSGTELNRKGLFTLPNSVPGTMSISATGPNDELVFYSNYGNNEVSVGAPGGGYETLEKTLSTETEWPFPLNLVLSTVPADVYGGFPDLASAYDWFAGTSMAAPQVTGVAALVASANPDLTASQVERTIVRGTEKATGRKKEDVGAGVLNAAGAVEEATGNGKRGNEK